MADYSDDEEEIPLEEEDLEQGPNYDGEDGQQRRKKSQSGGGPTDNKGYYAILGVPTTADAATIKRAYHQQSTLYHSDKLGNLDEETKQLMNERFQKINEANQILSDPRTRMAYDHSGRKGVERLALVPANFTTKHDVARALNAIAFEVEAKRAAKMVGASGKVTLSLNMLPLTGLTGNLRPKRRRRPQPPQPQQPSSPVAEESTVQSTSETTTESASTEAEGGVPPSPQQQHQQPQTGAGGIPPGGIQANVQAEVKKVMLDGKETYIMVPPENLQQMLRQQEAAMQQKQAAAAGGGEGGAMMDEDGSGVMDPETMNVSRRPRRRIGLLTAMMAASKPYQMELQHGMQMPITQLRNATVAMTATASHGGHGAVTSVKFLLETVRSQTTAISFTLKMVFGEGVKFSVRHARSLSLLWSMVSNLTLFDGQQLIPQYTVELTRKLTANMSLSNAWKMTVNGGGFFKSTIAHDASGGTGDKASSLEVNIGAGMLALTLNRRSISLFREGKKNEKKCRLTQTVMMQPLTGQTTIAYDILFPVGRMRKVGLGVSTTLPLSWSPLTPPLFLALSNNWRCITQFHLIFNQNNHTIALPMLVSVSPRLHTGVLMLSLPWMMYRLGRKVVTPFLELREARKSREARSAIAGELKEARQKALAEQEGLKGPVDARRAAEDSANGLVIVNATYSLRSVRLADASREPVPTSLDVTVPLQSLVAHSELHIPEGSLSDLPGFYNVDPAADPADRVLKVTYRFRGVMHKAELTDNDGVFFPQKEHRE